MSYSKEDLSYYRQDSEKAKECASTSKSRFYYLFKGIIEAVSMVGIFLLCVFLVPFYIMSSFGLVVSNLGRERANIDPIVNEYKLRNLTEKIGIKRSIVTYRYGKKYWSITDEWKTIHMIGTILVIIEIITCTYFLLR